MKRTQHCQTYEMLWTGFQLHDITRTSSKARWCIDSNPSRWRPAQGTETRRFRLRTTLAAREGLEVGELEAIRQVEAAACIREEPYM